MLRVLSTDFWWCFWFLPPFSGYETQLTMLAGTFFWQPFGWFKGAHIPRCTFNRCTGTESWRWRCHSGFTSDIGSGVTSQQLVVFCWIPGWNPIEGLKFHRFPQDFPRVSSGFLPTNLPEVGLDTIRMVSPLLKKHSSNWDIHCFFNDECLKNLCFWSYSKLSPSLQRSAGYWFLTLQPLRFALVTTAF